MRKVLVVLGLLGVLVVWAVLEKGSQQTSGTEPTSSVFPSPSAPPSTATTLKAFGLPISDFFNRITKKPFGIYITPENSPVQPERFTGYHTGADAEYEDAEEEVPVYAVCEGEIVEAKFVSGYGGAVVQRCEFDKRIFFVIYGHLNPASLHKTGPVTAGGQIGILGKGNSRETDGERKHLHLGIHKNTLDWRGYVESEAELAEWEEPKEFLKENRNAR